MVKNSETLKKKWKQASGVQSSSTSWKTKTRAPCSLHEHKHKTQTFSKSQPRARLTRVIYSSMKCGIAATPYTSSGMPSSAGRHSPRRDALPASSSSSSGSERGGGAAVMRRRQAAAAPPPRCLRATAAAMRSSSAPVTTILKRTPPPPSPRDTTVTPPPWSAWCRRGLPKPRKQLCMLVESADRLVCVPVAEQLAMAQSLEHIYRVGHGAIACSYVHQLVYHRLELSCCIMLRPAAWFVDRLTRRLEFSSVQVNEGGI